MNNPASLRPAPLKASDTPSNYALAYALCVKKIRKNIVTLADKPKAGAFAKDGEYFNFWEGFNDIGNWTSSFFTGMALLAHDTTKDDFFIQQCQRLGGAYRDKVFTHQMDTMHDLGFLYSLYSIPLYRRTKDPEHRRVALKAAEELGKRYIPAGKYIRAWGRMDEANTDYAGLAIIDCMMNLPLLFWAARELGDPRLHDIAVAHANTTIDVFVRPDDSVFHAHRFDAGTGAPTSGENYCGYSPDSHWARGNSWAIYGFALAYQFTKDDRYLDTSRRVARKFISQLDQDGVPLWDFRLPPDSTKLRDSSAAAIAASGLIVLAGFDPTEPLWNMTADRLLASLCSADYLDQNPNCRGVLKNAEVGDGKIPGTNCYQAINVYASWGDFFFMEALGRRLHGTVGYW